MVVGLGNPGAQYANTRHNVGHMLVDLLASNAGVQLSAHRSGTHCADIRLGMLPGGVPGPRVILAISDSYMNTSGGPIGRLAKFMNVAPSRLLVVHDDLDLPEGTLRLKTGVEKAVTTVSNQSPRSWAHVTTTGYGSELVAHRGE